MRQAVERGMLYPDWDRNGMTLSAERPMRAAMFDDTRSAAALTGSAARWA